MCIDKLPAIIGRYVHIDELPVISGSICIEKLPAFIGSCIAGSLSMHISTAALITGIVHQCTYLLLIAGGLAMHIYC